ncbi:MAG: Ig-like domain-containing protein [Caldilineaceae bacterium]|nr:Ig-like domain-containing protein [Caldilineaceae bacterium]
MRNHLKIQRRVQLLAIGYSILLICAYGFLLSPMPARAAGVSTVRRQTIIPGGSITANTTWTAAGSPYIVTGNLAIEPGVTLTIDPGVEVRFGEVWLWVRGHLQAEGTAGQLITFTSNAATPATGDWLYIQVDGIASLRHCTVAYGGRSGTHMLYLKTSNAQVRDCTLRHSQNAGVEIAGNDVRPLLQNTVVRNNGAAAIRQMVNTSPSYNGVSFSNNGVNGVVIPSGSYTVDSVLNGAGLSGGGYVAGGNLGIEAGATLTVTANTTLAFNEAWLWVLGHLQAEGTSTQPITFTSSAATPAAGDWYYIQVDGSARLRHCTVAYGGRGGSNMLRLYASNVHVRDCTLRHSQNAGVEVINGVLPLIIHNRIHDNGLGLRNATANTVVDARRNWWGHASGPNHASNPNGAGNGVSDGILFTPWLAAPDPDAGAVGRLLVQVGGPTRVSPGQTTRYAISYANLTDETVQNAVLMAALPGAAEYVSSTGGVYWPQRDQVFWRLGDLPPDASGNFVIEVRYLWGIPDDVVESMMGLIAGINQGDSAFDIQPYLDYAPVTLVNFTPLNAGEVQAERQTYLALDQLYAQAVADGFRLGSANRLTLNSGDPVTSLTFVAVNRGEAHFLRRQGSVVLAVTYGRGYYTIQNSSGGLRTNLDTFDIEFLGDWSPETTAADLGVESITAEVCLRNCLLTKLADLSAGKIMKVIDLIMKVDDCAKCAAGDQASCVKCGNNIADAAGKGVPGLGEIVDLKVCTTDCADPTKRGEYVCQAGKTITACAPTPQGWWDIPAQTNFRNALARRYIKWECAPDLGMWRKLPEFSYCDYATGERCVQGVKNAAGTPCKSCSTLDLATYMRAVPLETDQTLGSAGICRFVNAAGGGCAINETTVRVARDPNEKFGPTGDLLPGQTVNYTITYENEGAGQAFGVYILDELSEHFNDNTLVIHGPGQYITNTRTIFWNIGELAAKGQPGSTGVVSFTAALRSNLAGGAVIANQAVVHFPSVPEVTPTNAVVNLIQPVAAVPQHVETQTGQSVQIKLAGREVSNAALSFAVLESPLGGVLSGAAPNLSYTAATGFSGQDRFTFQVSNGMTVSRPAEVMIRVHPSPTDSTPPTVLWTEPLAGYQNQLVNSQPLFVGDNGPIYGPAILAQVSEPLDPSTVNGQTVSVLAGGQVLPLSVHFGEGINRIEIRLRQPLQPGTLYTVRLSTGLRDLKGNSLPGDYTWTFRTAGESAQRSLYLPHLSR